MINHLKIKVFIYIYIFIVDDYLEKEDRERLIERLLKNERVIEVISDKIFYEKKIYDENYIDYDE